MTAYLNQLGVVSALGSGLDAMRETLFATQPGGLQESPFFAEDRPLFLGHVREAMPSLSHHHERQRSRNNGLLLLALNQIRPAVEQAISKYGPHRVGIALGTSTSGIGEGELAVRKWIREGGIPSDYHYAKQELGAPATFLARELGVTGPSNVISTACSSSARSMAAAARWLDAGLVDAVITGGADSLCRFTIAGFSCLDSVSPQRCNPFSKNRRGINIGEAATLFLMTRERAEVRLAGWGETSDAHHMSAPEPSGRGAAEAMREALKRAGLQPGAIGYVNLHGTATPHNDAMESRAVEQVLGLDTWVSSTKSLHGHTLGASGALEAAISWLTLTDAAGRLPPHWYDGEYDPELPKVKLVPAGQRGARPGAVLSNSFAFGGSNATLCLARELA
ncbi:MAG: beta-ketoacyl-ACP synthase [Myxococcaceae bacterium]